MSEDLKYVASVVGFDKVEAALKGQTKALAETSVAAQKLDSTLQRTGSSGAQSMFNLTEKIRSLQSAVFTEKDVNKIKVYNAQILQTQKELSNLESVGTKSLGGLGNGAGAAYTKLQKLAYLIPGFGIGGLVLLAVEPLKLAFEYLTKATDEAILLKKVSADIAEINAEGNKAAGGTIADLKVLYAATQDVTLSMKERIKAAKELQELYPKTFGQFTTEQILLGQVKDAYNAQTISIIKNSQAKAAQGKLGELETQKLDAQVKLVNQLVEVGKKYSDYTKKIKDQQANSTEATPGSFAKSTAAITQGLKRDQKVYLDAFTKTVKDINAEEKIIIASVGENNLVDAIVGPPDKLKERSAAAKKTIQDVLDELRKELQFLGAKGLIFNTNESKAKIRELLSTAENLIKSFNVSPDNTVIGKLFGVDISFQGLLLKAKLLEGVQPQLISFADKVHEDIKAFLAKPIVAPVNVAVVPGKIDIQPLTVDLGEQLTAGLIDIAASAGAAFADTLAQAITSGSENVGDFFQGIFKSIGAGLKQLGQMFVKAGLAILIVKKALTSNPYLAIAAGLALEVLGGVLQNSFNKKQAFATGGLVGGTGTGDTVNALLTPGEFVMTRAAVSRIGVDNLAALNGGNSMATIGGNVNAGVQRIDGTLVSSIDGTVIRLALNRADARLSRIG